MRKIFNYNYRHIKYYIGEVENMQKIKRIVIPVDESDVSKVAVEQGTYFAKSLNADVSIISVNDTNQYMVSKILEEKVIKEKKSKLEEIKRIAQEKGLTATTTFVLGEPAEEITKFVKEDDLIVMASKGKKGINKFLLGSVSEEVLHRAPCAVMIIKPNTKKNLSDLNITNTKTVSQ